MSELLILAIPALVGIGILIGKYFAAKSSTTLDDVTLQLLEDNKQKVINELIKAAEELAKKRDKINNN
jgi:hypothetical protein